MRRIFLSFICLSVMTLNSFAAVNVIERTYISTDRDVYLSGEDVLCSAFTMAISDELEPSGISSTLYLELHSEKQMVATSKIALIKGRGAGSLSIPNSLPTGNYRLIAYTATNKNEPDYNYDNEWSKTISVFNVFSNERVEDGVEIVSEAEYSALIEKGNENRAEGVEFKKDAQSNGFVLRNTSSEDISVSVSVYHNNGFKSFNTACVKDFATALQTKGNRVITTVIPDYEGEVIHGKFVGADASGLGDIRNSYALISVPGQGSDCYLSPIAADGTVTFFTGNIYGNREIVCEIAGIDSTSESHIELISPFIDAEVSEIEPLIMSESLKQPLTAHSLAMQIEKAFVSDTLYDYLPVRPTDLFNQKPVRYILDDYTRLPTMEEVIVEFIKELRLKKTNGEIDFQIFMEDRYGDSYFSELPPLMMIDGVPVFNHNKILNYDPLLVEMIDIYPQIYCIGGREFMGVVNMTTYKRNMPSVEFDRNVRIINYQGVSYPAAYTGASIAGSDSYPDYRQTIYWHPILNIKSGESLDINCVMPDYEGDFTIVIEGLTENGEAVYLKRACF